MYRISSSRMQLPHHWRERLCGNFEDIVEFSHRSLNRSEEKHWVESDKNCSKYACCALHYHGKALIIAIKNVNKVSSSAMSRQRIMDQNMH
jgi:hypothetical protein